MPYVRQGQSERGHSGTILKHLASILRRQGGQGILPAEGQPQRHRRVIGGELIPVVS
jgi:hypothetical protein